MRSARMCAGADMKTRTVGTFLAAEARHRRRGCMPHDATFERVCTFCLWFRNAKITEAHNCRLMACALASALKNTLIHAPAQR